MEGKFIAYLRVSTDRQGRSGLGLAAQRQAIEDYLNGGKWKLLREFVEVESGKTNERPKLQEAIKACKRTGAKLLIAKLDRLSRNLAFIVNLRDSGVSFVAADMPDATEFTVNIFASLAEFERKLISKRTTEALAAAKARGVRLGKPENLTNKARLKGSKLGVQERQRKAREFALQTIGEVRRLQAEEMPLRAIARKLNEEEALTASGKVGSWSAMSVKNVIKQAEGAS